MKLLKNALFSTALSFTLITYFCSLFVHLSDNYTYAVTFESLTRFLIFSAVLGLAGMIFGIKKLPRSIARLIHFIVLCADFCLVIATMPYGSDFRMIFASLLIFIVIYWAVIGVCAVIKAIFKKSVCNK